MIEVRNLKKAYKIGEDREFVVLDDLTFNLPNKGLFFILGKSGSGKSTLLALLGGLLKPSEGEILINGKNVFSMKKKDKEKFLKSKIGFLFQKYNLIDDLSLKENLEVAASIKGSYDKTYVDSLINEYGLEETSVDEAKYLSGGEKQRAALIRAIMNKPNILLCDEPTGALDKENSEKLMSQLAKISRERLVICVTHNSELAAKYNDGYIYLENGKIKTIFIGENKYTSTELLPQTLPKKENKKKYINKIVNKNMHKNIRINILSIFSSFFSIAVILLSLFFNSGIKNNKENLINSYVDRSTFKVSKEETSEIENSLVNVVKNERPKSEDVYFLLEGCDYIILNSYDFYFTGDKSLIFNNEKINDFNLLPYVDLSIDENYVYFNDAMKEKFSFLSDIKENDEITLSLKKTFYYFNEEIEENIKENFYIDLNFIFKEFKREFRYLSMPTFYYSPIYLEKVLKSKSAIETTKKVQKEITYFDLVNDAKPDNELSSFASYLFSFNEKTNERIYEKMNKNHADLNLNFTNNGYILVNSFLDLTNSIFLGLNIFIVICLITSFFISSFLAYSSSLDNRKESAILSVLGAREDDVLSIYLTEQISYVLLGACLGILGSYSLSYIINFFLKKFLVSEEIIQIDIIVALVVACTYTLISFVLNYLPLKFKKSRPIYEELKEE